MQGQAALGCIRQDRLRFPSGQTGGCKDDGQPQMALQLRNSYKIYICLIIFTKLRQDGVFGPVKKIAI